MPALNCVYTLVEDYVNFLQPVLELVKKARNGPRVHRRYDPAQTPYRRLLSLDNPPAATRHHLKHTVMRRLVPSTLRPPSKRARPSFPPISAGHIRL
jgi:hypothetical protein